MQKYERNLYKSSKKTLLRIFIHNYCILLTFANTFVDHLQLLTKYSHNAYLHKHFIAISNIYYTN